MVRYFIEVRAEEENQLELANRIINDYFDEEVNVLKMESGYIYKTDFDKDQEEYLSTIYLDVLSSNNFSLVYETKAYSDLESDLEPEDELLEISEETDGILTVYNEVINDTNNYVSVRELKDGDYITIYDSYDDAVRPTFNGGDIDRRFQYNHIDLIDMIMSHTVNYESPDVKQIASECLINMITDEDSDWNLDSIIPHGGDEILRSYMHGEKKISDFDEHTMLFISCFTCQGFDEDISDDILINFLKDKYSHNIASIGDNFSRYIDPFESFIEELVKRRERLIAKCDDIHELIFYHFPDKCTELIDYLVGYREINFERYASILLTIYPETIPDEYSEIKFEVGVSK